MGLGVFQRDYFANHPVYLDKEQNMLKMFGVKLTCCDLCGLIPKMFEMSARLKSKGGVDGNLNNGDGSVQGGVLVLGRGGKNPTFQQEYLGKAVNKEQVANDVRKALV
uniref:Uncharacterized protein n=1 Tax=Hemiselmis tepida TaxID=464990 RepID=A0A7S0YRF1_9CRYP|mmetsp:Transcript_18826/g.47485  ORF Transcript_18826/g.47485 Transcript_18826/m.47485 type:complete len:108 (+) Transcript_18826:295-618(+)